MNREIKLKKEIYPIRALNRAITDYKSICPILLKDKKDYYKCTFYAKVDYLEQVKDEFCNYLIELINGQVNA